MYGFKPFLIDELHIIIFILALWYIHSCYQIPFWWAPVSFIISFRSYDIPFHPGQHRLACRAALASKSWNDDSNLLTFKCYLASLTLGKSSKYVLEESIKFATILFNINECSINTLTMECTHLMMPGTKTKKDTVPLF